MGQPIPIQARDLPPKAKHHHHITHQQFSLIYLRYMKHNICIYMYTFHFFFFYFFPFSFHNKTTLLLLSSSKNLIPSKFDATPSLKLFSSRSMSHKNPYPLSSHLGLIWVTVLELLVFVSLENWRRPIKELLLLFWLWFGIWWWWWWWVAIEEENGARNWLYPIDGVVFWLVGDDEAKVRDGTVLSYMMSLALLSALPLWNTLHKTQSSCNQQQ